MPRPLPSLSSPLVERGQQLLTAYGASVTGLQMALLATPDGFEIACVINRGELQGSRIAAMASSMMAMASAVGREIKSTGCRRLTFEADGSSVVLHSVAAKLPCILCVVVNSDALLGKVFWLISEFVREMEKD